MTQRTAERASDCEPCAVLLNYARPWLRERLAAPRGQRVVDTHKPIRSEAAILTTALHSVASLFGSKVVDLPSFTDFDMLARFSV